jgi:Uma2 family endonuclease
MATSTLLPLEVYLRTNYRPDCEWIDGEVRERNVGEAPHSAAQKFLINNLSANEEIWGVTVWPEQRVQTSATHFRVPDICLTRDSGRYEVIFTVPPLLCIELMSYDDRLNEILERAEDYLAMGVLAVWILDLRRREAFVAHRSGLEKTPERLWVDGWPIKARLSDVLAYVDKIEARR